MCRCICDSDEEGEEPRMGAVYIGFGTALDICLRREIIYRVSGGILERSVFYSIHYFYKRRDKSRIYITQRFYPRSDWSLF